MVYNSPRILSILVMLALRILLSEGDVLGGCDAFPAVANPPVWLQTPDTVEGLTSNKPYAYLAGRLISKGFVDAVVCPGLGLLENGFANSCGMDVARGEVYKWQNQFDEQILQVSRSTGVPGHLLKNVIAQESQFWPGGFDGSYEYGLGRMTAWGADTILTWNPSFYREFCPFVLHPEVCNTNYVDLDQDAKSLLRGALTVTGGAECSNCINGFKLGNAKFSIYLLAQVLLASCEQVEQIIYNTTYLAPHQVSTSEDFARYILVNYNAGPGCLTHAISSVRAAEHNLTWVNVANALPEGCRNSIQYVDNITR